MKREVKGNKHVEKPRELFIVSLGPSQEAELAHLEVKNFLHVTLRQN